MQTGKIFKRCGFVLLLYAALFIIDKRVINIIEVDFCVAFFALFDHSTRPLDVTLLDYLFVEVVRY